MTLLQLAQVGGKRFLDLEAETFMNFESSSKILSLTGSQPMNVDAMAHARSLGVYIWLIAACG